MNNPPLRLSRSMLFVPAIRMDMIEKAFNSAADIVCFDLEDSIALDKKAAARKNIIQALLQLDLGAQTRMIRINSLDSSFTYQDVIEIVEAVGNRIDLIMLPKVQKPEDVYFLDTLLTQIELHMGLSTSIGIEAQIETAKGFINLKKIGKSSSRLESLAFGPGDYAASMHMPLENIGQTDIHDAQYPGHRWHAAMHKVVAVARANGQRCMDGPYANYGDTQGFENSCRLALAMGFDGKHCIHPAQLEIANNTFSPSTEQVERAAKIIAAYEKAESEGKGVISLEGIMVDRVNLRLARNILLYQQAIEERKGQGAT